MIILIVRIGHWKDVRTVQLLKTYPPALIIRRSVHVKRGRRLEFLEGFLSARSIE